MSFKDMVQEDIQNTFLNFEEFGEEHWIEGRPCIIVLDNDELKVRQGGGDLAVAESAALFYTQTENLPRGLYPGSSLNIDNRENTVDDIKEDMGMSTVVLRENIMR